MSKLYYGIDLGSTSSRIASVNDDGYVQIAAYSQYIGGIPSVVAFGENGKILIGRAAKAQWFIYPESTVALTEDVLNCCFSKIIYGNSYDSIDILSIILKHLVDSSNKQRAEEGGLYPISDVVIALPLYFGREEKYIVFNAAKKAGLNCVKFIGTPIAAVTMVINRFPDRYITDKTLMVYHLGGSYFDVCILKISDKNIEVLSCCGDKYLGGIDWDRAIAEYVLNEIGATLEQLSECEQRMLIYAAEECKLCLRTQTKTTLTFRYEKIHNILVTKDIFEEQTKPLVDRTIFFVEEALQEAGLDKDINEILLVGGSTRMPMIHKRIVHEFSSSQILSLEPELSVVKGAALIAYELSCNSIIHK